MMGRTPAITVAVTLAAALLVRPAGASADDAGHVRWCRGFEIHSADGNYRLAIRGRVHPRFALMAGEEGVEALGFRIRRGRIAFEGHVFDPTLRFSLQLDVLEPRLLDLYVEVLAPGGLAVRAGQFKMPYSRQYLNSSSALQLIERSTVVSHLTTGARLGPDRMNVVDRDVGLMVSWRGGPRDAVYVRAGAFNGEGMGSTGEVDTGLAYALRFDLTPLGRVPDEGTYESHETRLGIGWSAAVNPQRFVGNAAQAGVDVTLASGGLFTTAELHLRRYEGDGGAVRDLGFFLQAGYLVLPDPAIEVAARYGRAELGHGTGSRHEELTSGLTWYVHGHRAKLQLDHVAERRRMADATVVGHSVILQGALGFR